MVDKVGGVEFDVVVDSTQASASLAKFSDQVQKLTSKLKPLDSSTVSLKSHLAGVKKRSDLAAKATANLSRNVGMGAVQFGQLAGQIQGGQSAMLAFSQQGADIGMLFGPAGMVVGGILAVGSALVGSMIPSLMDSGDEVETLSEKLKELQKENKLTEAQTKFLASEEAKASKEKAEKIKVLQEEIKENQALIEKNQQLIVTSRKLSNQRKDSSPAQIQRQAIIGIKEANEELIQSQAELDSLMGKTGGDTDETKRAKDEAKFKAKTRLDMLKSSLEGEANLLRWGSKNRLSIKQGEMTAAEAMAIESDIAANNRIKASHEMLLVSLENEKRSILENKMLTEEEKAALELQYRDLELQAKQNKDDELIRQQQAFSDKMVDIKEKEESAKRMAVAGAFGNVAQLMNTESRKLFEIGKAAALANATITGYDAATTNYKKGSEIGGPVVGAAFAAASLAATFAQIQSIKSTQFGSGGGGQSVQGGQVSNTGSVGPQAPGQNVSVSGIDPSSLVSGQQLIDLLNEYAGDGAKFNFAGG